MKAINSIVAAPKGDTVVLGVTVSEASPDVPNNPSNRTCFGPAGVIRESDKFKILPDRYTLIVLEIKQNDVGIYIFHGYQYCRQYKGCNNSYNRYRVLLTYQVTTDISNYYCWFSCSSYCNCGKVSCHCTSRIYCHTSSRELHPMFPTMLITEHGLVLWE